MHVYCIFNKTQRGPAKRYKCNWDFNQKQHLRKKLLQTSSKIQDFGDFFRKDLILQSDVVFERSEKLNPAIPFRDIFGHPQITFLLNMVSISSSHIG